MLWSDDSARHVIGEQTRPPPRRQSDGGDPRLADVRSGHCREQDDGVFERPQRVHGVGHDEEVFLPGLPGLTCSGQFYSSGQHQDGGLAGILVLV